MPNYNGFNYGPSPMNSGIGPEADFKGKWFSKKTGENVYVRDNIISDSGMQVILSDGRLMDLNDFGNEYIRVSDEIYDKNGKVINQSPVDSVQDIVPSYFPYEHEDHVQMMAPSLEHNHSDDNPFATVIPPTKPSSNEDLPNNQTFKEGNHMYMVKSVFENTDPKPSIYPKLTIVENGFPKDQLQMLIDIFGVSIDDIASYMYKTYFSSDKILEVIKYWLLNVDNCGLKEKLKEKIIETKPEMPVSSGSEN